MLHPAVAGARRNGNGAIGQLDVERQPTFVNGATNRRHDQNRFTGRRLQCA